MRPLVKIISFTSSGIWQPTKKKSTLHWHVIDINTSIFFVLNTWSWKSVISSISKVHVCLFCLQKKKGWYVIYWLTQELLNLECWWKDTLAHKVWKKLNKSKSKIIGISCCHFWNLKDVPSIFSLHGQSKCLPTEFFCCFSLE